MSQARRNLTRTKYIRKPNSSFNSPALCIQYKAQRISFPCIYHDFIIRFQTPLPSACSSHPYLHLYIHINLISDTFSCVQSILFHVLSCSSLRFLSLDHGPGRYVSLLVQCGYRLGVHRHLVTSNSTVHPDRDFALKGAKSSVLLLSNSSRIFIGPEVRCVGVSMLVRPCWLEVSSVLLARPILIFCCGFQASLSMSGFMLAARHHCTVLPFVLFSLSLAGQRSVGFPS